MEGREGLNMHNFATSQPDTGLNLTKELLFWMCSGASCGGKFLPQNMLVEGLPIFSKRK
jgi:hypothetical protein